MATLNIKEKQTKKTIKIKTKTLGDAIKKKVEMKKHYPIKTHTYTISN